MTIFEIIGYYIGLFLICLLALSGILLFFLFIYYVLQEALLCRRIRISLKRTDLIDLDYLASLYDLKK